MPAAGRGNTGGSNRRNIRRTRDPRYIDDTIEKVLHARDEEQEEQYDEEGEEREIEVYTPQASYEEEIVYDDDITDDYQNTQRQIKKRRQEDLSRDITDDADEIIDKTNGIATEDELDDEDRAILGLPKNEVKGKPHPQPRRPQPQDIRRAPQPPQRRQEVTQQWQEQPQPQYQPQYQPQSQYQPQQPYQPFPYQEQPYQQFPQPPYQPPYQPLPYQQPPYQPEESKSQGGLLSRIRGKKKKAAEQAFDESLYHVPQGQPPEQPPEPPNNFIPSFGPEDDSGGSKLSGLRGTGSQILTMAIVSIVVVIALTQFLWPYPSKNQYIDDVTRLEGDLVAMRSTDEKLDDRINTIKDQAGTVNSLANRLDDIEGSYATKGSLESYVTIAHLGDTVSEEIENELDRLGHDILSEDDVNDLIDDRIDTVSDDMGEINNDLDDLQNSASYLQAQIDSLSSNTNTGNNSQTITTLQNTVTALAAEINTIRIGNLTDINDAIGDINEVISETSEALEEINVTLANLQNLPNDQNLSYSLTGSGNQYLFSIESKIDGKYVARIMLVYPVAQSLSGNTTDAAMMNFFNELIDPNRNYVPRIVYNGVAWQLAEIECYTSSFTLAANVPAQYYLTLAGLQNFPNYEPYIEVLKSGTSSNVGNGGSI